jgi:hypothetical protein
MQTQGIFIMRSLYYLSSPKRRHRGAGPTRASFATVQHLLALCLLSSQQLPTGPGPKEKEEKEEEEEGQAGGGSQGKD